jgi:hypothetical protein
MDCDNGGTCNYALTGMGSMDMGSKRRLLAVGSNMNMGSMNMGSMNMGSMNMGSSMGSSMSGDDLSYGYCISEEAKGNHFI